MEEAIGAKEALVRETGDLGRLKATIRSRGSAPRSEYVLTCRCCDG